MSHAADAVEPIYSAYQSDEDFRELLEDFYTAAHERREELQTSFAAGELVQVRTQAHQLKGAGGGYGFDGLSELAAHLEDACRQPAPQLDEIAPLLDRVVDYLGRIRI